MAPGALIASLGEQIDPELLVLALTHRSFAHEAGGIPTNERLEFLGDSVLGVVVTEHLFTHHPDVPEGSLAKMRAACVSQRALASVAGPLGLGRALLLGRGEAASGGAEKDSILSDTLEAVIGATFLSVGLDRTRTMVLRLLEPLLSSAASAGAGLDWKTSLQERSAELGLGVPAYHVDHTGPDHARSFTARVTLSGVERGHGTGTAKKHAEQGAAEMAFLALVDPTPDGAPPTAPPLTPAPGAPASTAAGAAAADDGPPAAAAPEPDAV
ncbi:ribonuclease III [Litorihabitans aurantiacus]|uniref:Ribonuclease 3 n=1 Tax=Litorihabitans aurantiacus TaxID=1930061 RepID=A0AA37XBD4_9MICO|nr:ribonuclease III [Litorihabitans aurantiacus]GMA30854.1 ribonuclease 3 [Litorihabitans aurantiacus]